MKEKTDATPDQLKVVPEALSHFGLISHADYSDGGNVATKQRSTKQRKPSLQERQVLALERIANSLETIGIYVEGLGLPVSICTITGDGKVFPLDVFVQERSETARQKEFHCGRRRTLASLFLRRARIATWVLR